MLFLPKMALAAIVCQALPWDAESSVCVSTRTKALESRWNGDYPFYKCEMQRSKRHTVMLLICDRQETCLKSPNFPNAWCPQKVHEDPFLWAKVLDLSLHSVLCSPLKFLIPCAFQRDMDLIWQHKLRYGAGGDCQWSSSFPRCILTVAFWRHSGWIFPDS